MKQKFDAIFNDYTPAQVNMASQPVEIPNEMRVMDGVSFVEIMHKYGRQACATVYKNTDRLNPSGKFYSATVNWPGMGSVLPEDAERMVAVLTLALEIAKQIDLTKESYLTQLEATEIKHD